MPDKADVLDARILIVDDLESNVQLLEKMLIREGYRQVTSTQDPFAVCDLHACHHYDLILLDLQMPGMDGFSVLEGLSQIEASGYVPVLAITAASDCKLRALAAGAKDFIAKPFELAELSIRIHNLLEVRLLYKELDEAVNELESFALHDALTGLANRRLLIDRLNQSRLSSARTGNHSALMFLDIDHFKQINDTLGHDAGDLLLQQVSQRLLLCVREGDCVARFGGDEFVVLLDALGPNEADAAQHADHVAQKILHGVAQTFDLQGHNFETSMSIGAVVFQGIEEPVSDLLKQADRAMYRAKSKGRSQVCFYDMNMQAAVLKQDRLLHELRHGLSAHEFELFYQIQVDGRGMAVGAEALVRWHHAGHGLMLPGQFIALAEETGLILSLGHWVLETACQQLLVWAANPLTAAWTLAVNIGACQMAQADVATSVGLALEKTGAPASKLVLELTEGTLLNDVEDTLAKLNAIRALGVGLCLDDFGAGFASLAYLKRMPLAQLKIDQAIVHNALSDDSVAVIARAIGALGTSLGLPVIAEGIETHAQLEFFSAMGCAAFQGNYIGAVAQAAEMVDCYMKNRPSALMDGASAAITLGAIVET
jgi:diguanylate cyclase (GGDEF)-like protein